MGKAAITGVELDNCCAWGFNKRQWERGVRLGRFVGIVW